jgi:hypothetical protein
MFSMFRKKRLDMRFVGPTLAQIEEIERLSGKSIGAIVSESVNVWNWLYKERLNGADRPFDHLKQILQILLPAQTALLGSAMGFYYGSRARGSGEGE